MLNIDATRINTGKGSSKIPLELTIDKDELKSIVFWNGNMDWRPWVVAWEIKILISMF